MADHHTDNIQQNVIRNYLIATTFLVEQQCWSIGVGPWDIYSQVFGEVHSVSMCSIKWGGP